MSTLMSCQFWELSSKFEGLTINKIILKPNHDNINTVSKNVAYCKEENIHIILANILEYFIYLGVSVGLTLQKVVAASGFGILAIGC